MFELYYELRRGSSLTFQEKETIKSITQRYAKDQELHPNWQGGSCSKPVFRCFEVPLLYAEQISVSDDAEHTYKETAHWCNMLYQMYKELTEVEVKVTFNDTPVELKESTGFFPYGFDAERFPAMKIEDQADMEVNVQNDSEEEPLQAMTQENPTHMEADLQSESEEESLQAMTQEDQTDMEMDLQNDSKEEPFHQHKELKIPLLKTAVYLEKTTSTDVERQIQTLEEQLQIVLPFCYRYFLLRYNGGKAIDTYYTRDMYGREISYYIERFYGFYEGFGGFGEKIDSSSFHDFIDKGYFCFADDAFENLFLIGIRGAQYGKIAYYAQNQDIQILSNDFTQFLQDSHSKIDFFDTSDFTQVEVACGVPDFAETRTDMDYKQRIQEETATDKENTIRRIMLQQEPMVMGYLHFDNFPLKLAVIQELMYCQKRLPIYNIYKEMQKLGLNSEGQLRKHGPLLFALTYFKELKIPEELAEHVHTLHIDTNNAIYENIDLEWTGKKSFFDIEDITDADIAPFKNLEEVTIRMGSLAGAACLRRHNIKVLTVYDDVDYSTTHCEKLLMENKAWVAGDASLKNLLDELRTCFGEYYQELYDPMFNESSADELQQPVWNTGKYTAAKLLQRVHLSLILYVDEEMGKRFFLTRDIDAFQQTVQRIDDTFNMIQEHGLWILNHADMDVEKASVKADLVHDQAVDKERKEEKKIKKKMSKNMKIVVISLSVIVFAIVLAFIISVWVGSHATYVPTEDLNYGYKVVCKGNDRGCMLQNTQGTALVSEEYSMIDTTYSSLLVMTQDTETGYDRIYDVKAQAYIDNEFLYIEAVSLTEKGNKLDYKGIITTKDEHHYYLYSEKHKEGIKVPVDEEDDYYFPADAYDVDTGEEQISK